MAALVKAHAEGHLEERLAFYAKPKLLIVDELGYLPFEAHAAHLFFQLVSRRYERGSLLITSNRSVGEWGEVFGDAVVATAILDRLPRQPRPDDHRRKLPAAREAPRRRAERAHATGHPGGVVNAETAIGQGRRGGYPPFAHRDLIVWGSSPWTKRG